MTTTEQLTAVDIATAVRAGTLTARAAVEARIDERNPQIDAFQQVRAVAALREADAVDARPDRAGLPLAGVPVAIKDNVPVEGEPMRIGSLGSDPAPQPSDHEVVRRLRAAGGRGRRPHPGAGAVRVRRHRLVLRRHP